MNAVPASLCGGSGAKWKNLLRPATMRSRPTSERTMRVIMDSMSASFLSRRRLSIRLRRSAEPGNRGQVQVFYRQPVRVPGFDVLEPAQEALTAALIDAASLVRYAASTSDG